METPDTTLEQDAARSAHYKDGWMIIKMESGAEVRFLVADNSKLANGTNEELNQIDISSYGLHWPALGEELCIKDLLRGEFGKEGNFPGRPTGAPGRSFG